MNRRSLRTGRQAMSPSPLTDDKIGECIEVTIHGVKHYLHSSTARELTNMLTTKFDEWNATARADGWPEV